jgi:hypothetical protein
MSHPFEEGERYRHPDQSDYDIFVLAINGVTLVGGGEEGVFMAVQLTRQQDAAAIGEPGEFLVLKADYDKWKKVEVAT